MSVEEAKDFLDEQTLQQNDLSDQPYTAVGKTVDVLYVEEMDAKLLLETGAIKYKSSLPWVTYEVIHYTHAPYTILLLPWVTYEVVVL
jgi:hypothetical protein